MPFLSWTGADFSITPPLNLQATSGPVFGAGLPGDTFNRVELRGNGTIAFGTGAALPALLLSRAAGPVLSVNDPFDISAAGSGLQVAEGSNAKQGTATLVAGTLVVANTSVTASSRIFLTCNTPGGTPGWLQVSARTAGTSFTILSSSGADTSVVAYEIFEPG
jgi:hypothetical protein